MYQMNSEQLNRRDLAAFPCTCLTLYSGIKGFLRLAALAAITLLASEAAFAGWERQWIDSFDGSEVDWTKWTAQVQANFNNEVQCYTDDDDLSSPDRNLEVAGGTLKIIARKMDVNCAGLGGQARTWTSARLNSKDKREFKYGRIEARIRIDSLLGGTWPAFWMLENRIAEDPIAGDNDNVNWPNPGAGEIDVWEWYSNNPDPSYITNFYNAGSCGSENRHIYPGGAGDVTGWHTYAIEWTADSISFYRDNTLMVTHDMTACTQYEEPMFVLLNLGMGGTLGGNIDSNLNTATLEIDYVAHCAETDTNNEQGCNEQTPVAPDGDEDGVNDADDRCSNTAPGTIVNAAGCPLEAGNNHAPDVSLTIRQGGLQTSNINSAESEVTITARITDSDSDDTHTLTWSLPGVSDAVESGSTLRFSPSDLSEGSYNVSVEVRDDGTPSLTDVSSATFSVAKIADGVGGGGGGGAMGLVWLSLLSLFGLVYIRRQSGSFCTGRS